MQFISLIKLVICIFNICTSLWFLDNVLIYTGKIKCKTKFIFIVVITFFIILSEGKGILLPILCYYIILFMYGVYIKAKLNLLNIFWIIRSVSDCIAVFLILYIFGALLKNYTFVEFYNENSLLSVIIFLFSVLFRISIIKTYIKQKLVIENLSNNQILISSIIFLIIQFLSLATLSGSIIFDNPVTIYEVILAILLFVVNIFFCKILTFLSNEIEEKYILEISIKQRELEEKYIKEISQMYTDIKSWKHDYRNNINVICNLAIANKHDELFKYIEELDKEIIIAKAIIYTGVLLIDSVITSKYLYGNSKGVKFNINTGKIKKGNISDFDLNIILSNLLDNAIEGALKSKEKKIDIIILEKDSNILFKIINTFDGNVKKVNGNYITTKEGHIHGLGINRVINAVNKYNGVIYTSNNDYIFENKVIIPIE